MITSRRALAAAAAAIAAFTFAACSSSGRVRVDQDPLVDMRAYRTFAFYPRPDTDYRGYQSILTKRLEYDTREQMEALGYVYDEADPQLRVNFVVKVADKMELRSTPTGMGPLRYRGAASNLESINYRVGTLRIDLVDVGRRTLVWQGVAEGRLEDREMRHPGPEIETAVKEIFAAFAPPKADTSAH